MRLLNVMKSNTYSENTGLCVRGWWTMLGIHRHAMLWTQRKCTMWAKRRMAVLFIMISHPILSSTRVGDFAPDLPTTDADGQPLLSNKMHRISCHEKGYRVIQ